MARASRAWGKTPQGDTGRLDAARSRGFDLEQSRGVSCFHERESDSARPATQLVLSERIRERLGFAVVGADGYAGQGLAFDVGHRAADDALLARDSRHGRHQHDQDMARSPYRLYYEHVTQLRNLNLEVRM